MIEGNRLCRCLHTLIIVLSAGIFLSGCLPHKEVPEYSDELFNLRLTEIHYYPAVCGTVPGDSLEFIELKNVGSTALELGGIEFVNGINYTFPVSATLDPNEFYVIASSRRDLEACYGAIADAEYSGLLRNSGDTIKAVYFPTGKVIVYQFYADSGAWPKEPDGEGHSLVPTAIDPGENDTGPAFWRSSANLNGSPGIDDLLKPFDSTLYNLRITEINYHPLYALDTLGADSLEFIELKNIGSKPVDLTDVEFIKGINYKFAEDATLDGGAFLVLASNAAWFEKQYHVKPFDVFTGQLRNSGETITISDVEARVTVVSVTYSDDKPWPEKADGDGWTLVSMGENPGSDEQNNPALWRTSFRINGSPGKNDPGVVFINEVLPHTDAPNVDAIELYNPGDYPVDIGGWYLTDRAAVLKYCIPDSTMVPAGGYKVFTADEFNKDSTAPGSFALSELGDTAFIMADAAGCKGFCHKCAFGPMANGISLGRYIIPSTGNEVFIPMKSVTLGVKNSSPLIGPLVVSEIMHQPGSGKPEYIEITNIGNGEMLLFDKDYPDNTWHLQVEDQKYSFPKNISIKADESFLVTFGTQGVDAFRNAYGVNVGILVFPFNGTLPDSAAKIELEKPLPPEKDIDGTIIGVYYMKCEKVSYKNIQPWPTGANGTDLSLTRIDNNQFGNDPANWKVANPSPGKTR